jgi:hypothetical protein
MREIVVLDIHLEELVKTLEMAHTYHAARDLAKEAEKMATAPSSSRLTRALDAQLQRVRGYLDEPVPDE